jgi:hypothetical protein
MRSALFAALVDDAGLFPPEQLPMPMAVARHRADARAGHPVLTHRFLCPASRLAELRAALAPGESWRLGLVADTGLDGVPGALEEIAADPRLRLETIEVRLPAAPDPGAAADQVAAAARQAPGGAAVYVELPLSTQDWNAAVRQLARRGMNAKIRCGGKAPELFPTDGQLTGFLTAVVAAQVPFKATAGLHHAVRYTDHVTGFDHHGFLNLALAMCRSVEAAGQEGVRAVLRQTDGQVLAAQARAVSQPTAARARSLLVAYGSCSTSEPVEDLAALGLVEVTHT